MLKYLSLVIQIWKLLQFNFNDILDEAKMIKLLYGMTITDDMEKKMCRRQLSQMLSAIFLIIQ